MSNMGYCKFENTVGDIEDCIEAINESNADLKLMMDGANEFEAKGMKEFVNLCKDVAKMFEDDDPLLS